MKLTNLETYVAIVKELGKEKVKSMYEHHRHERIRVSTLFYVLEQMEIVKDWDGKKPIEYLADEKGVSKQRVYRALEWRKILGIDKEESKEK
jgi:hypothetical protein